MWQTNKYISFPNGPQPHPQNTARLDREHYNGLATMAREWSEMWQKTWLLAGLEQDVEEAGDFLTFDIGTESILVTRTFTGELRAHYNVCQHRGNRLQMLSLGSVAGRHTCPYHGWSYDLEGRLVNVPDQERFGGRVDCATRSLKSVQVQAWAGMVWINMDPHAPPLEAFLGSIMAEIEPYHIDHMVLARDQTCALDANWKTVIDNFSEVYHVDFIHAQHASFVNCRDAHVDLYPFGHTAFRVEGYVLSPRYPVPEVPPEVLVGALEGLGLDPASFVGRVPDVRRAAQKRKRELGVEVGLDYTDLSDAQLSDIWQYNLFPNIIMTIKPEEVWIMRPRPHPTDPGKCLFDKLTLAMPLKPTHDGVSPILIGDPAVANISRDGPRPCREEFTQDQVRCGEHSMTETVDQDICYLPDMQAGMRSNGFETAVLSNDENRIAHMHNWLEDWLAGNPLLKAASLA